MRTVGISGLQAGEDVKAFGRVRPITEWSKDSGIGDTTIIRRLALGWSTEDAVSVPVGTRRSQAKLVEIDGVTKNLSEWARDKGIKRNALGQRIKNGMDVRQAILKPSKEKQCA